MSRLKSYSLPDNKPDENGPEMSNRSNDFDDVAKLECSRAIDFIMKKIKVESTIKLKKGRLNPFHCAEFGSRLLELTKQFVLWTTVMTKGDQQISTPPS